MGIDAQFQTIVYEESTGKIHSIHQNQYIKSRKSLNYLLGMKESPGLKFFYFQSNYPVSSKGFRVAVSLQGQAPRLVTKDNQDPAMVFLRHEAAYIVDRYKSIIFRFEGGMGDYMDQADALIEAGKKYPGKKFKSLLPHGSRRAALELLEGFKIFGSVDPKGYKKGSLVEIDFNRINNLRGYAPAGKIGAYSAIAGLDAGAPHSMIKPSEEDLHKAREIMRERDPEDEKIIIALHTVSGNTNTKSIANDMLPRLLSLLIEDERFLFFHFGGAGEEVSDHPRIIPFQGKLNWVEVFSLISLCDACVCIDSAILHIAQHAGIPTLSFWGPTDPVNILGEYQSVTSILSTATCRGCNSYACDDQNCMIQFDWQELRQKLRHLKKKTISKTGVPLRGSTTNDRPDLNTNTGLKRGV